MAKIRFVRIFGLSCMLLIYILGCSGKATRKNLFVIPETDSKFSMARFWNDGKAEVAKYKARKKLYGKFRSYTLSHITVTEPFSLKTYTKEERGRKRPVIPSIKFLTFSRIDTENYPYHFSIITHIKRNQPFYVLKLVASSQEWCGTTYKYFEDRNNTIEYHSYFQNIGGGKGSNVIRDSRLVFEDQLAVSLRFMDFKKGFPFKANFIKSYENNIYTPKECYPVKFVYHGVVKVSVPAGEFKAHKITYKRKGFTDEYYIAAGVSRYLLKVVTKDKTYSLKSVERKKYWER